MAGSPVLEGVAITANNAYDSAIRIISLFRTDRERIVAASDQTSSIIRMHELLQSHPFLNASQAREKSGLSAPTVNKAFEILERLGIVQEITGKQRGRVFAYQSFLDILAEGTSVST